MRNTLYLFILSSIFYITGTFAGVMEGESEYRLKMDHSLQTNFHHILDQDEIFYAAGARKEVTAEYDMYEDTSEMLAKESPLNILSTSMGDYLEPGKQFDSSFGLNYNFDDLVLSSSMETTFPEMQNFFASGLDQNYFSSKQEVNCSELFRDNLYAVTKIGDIVSYGLDDLGINQYESGETEGKFSNFYLNFKQSNEMDLSYFKGKNDEMLTSYSVLLSYARKNLNMGFPYKNSVNNSLGITLDCSKYGRIVCPDKLVDTCAEKVLKNELRYALYEESQNNLAKGCYKSIEGVVLPDNFRALMEKFDYDSCMQKANQHERCGCLKDKQDLLLDDQIIHRTAMNIRGNLISQNIGQSLKGLTDVISAKKVLDLSGKSGELETNDVNALSICTEMTREVANELIYRCKESPVAFEFVKKVFNSNKVSPTPIEKPEDLADFFVNTIGSLKERQAYSAILYKNFLEDLNNFDNAVVNNQSEDKDKAIYDLLTQKTAEELNEYLIRVVKNHRENKSISIDGSYLQNLIRQNPVFGESEFIFCLDGTYDEDCIQQILGPINLDANDPQLIEKLSSGKYDLLHTLYQVGTNAILNECSQAQKDIFDICDLGSTKELNGLSPMDVAQTFYDAFVNSKDDKEKHDAVSMQRQIFMCAAMDRDFNPRVYDEINGKNGVKNEDVARYNPKTSADLANLGKRIATDALFNTSTEMNENDMNKLKEQIAKNLINKRNLDLASGTMTNEDLPLVKPHLNETMVKESEIVDSGTKSNTLANTINSSISSMASSLSPTDVAELQSVATKKVESLESGIDAKERRLAELEKQLAENKNKDKESSSSTSGSSSSESELLELIKGLKGEINSLKSDLKTVQAEKGKLEQVAKKQSESKVATTAQPRSTFNGYQQKSSGYTSTPGEKIDHNIINGPNGTSATSFIGGASTSSTQKSSGGQTQHITNATSVGSSLGSGQGTYISSSGVLTFTTARSEQILKPENVQELYSLLKERGEVQVTNSKGQLEIIRPIFDETGEIVGTKIVLVDGKGGELKDKEKSDEENTKKKVVQETKEVKPNEGQNAYYEYLKSLFTK